MLSTSSILNSTVRSSISKIAGRSLTSRSLSTNCEAAQRLRTALADYQREHYSRETPRRFKQEVLSPYVVGNAIDVEQLNRLLINIGHSNDCLSVKEQNQLLQEAGCSGRSIPVGTLAALLG